jgi:hypothetical protein
MPVLADNSGGQQTKLAGRGMPDRAPGSIRDIEKMFHERRHPDSATVIDRLPGQCN